MGTSQRPCFHCRGSILPHQAEHAVTCDFCNAPFHSDCVLSHLLKEHTSRIPDSSKEHPARSTSRRIRREVGSENSSGSGEISALVCRRKCFVTECPFSCADPPRYFVAGVPHAHRCAVHRDMSLEARAARLENAIYKCPDTGRRVRPRPVRLGRCTSALEEASLWRGIALAAFGIQRRRIVQDSSHWRGTIVSPPCYSESSGRSVGARVLVRNRKSY